ncbi:MAG: lysine--tRNA ligase, partial [Idiomarina loihiensis]
MTDKSQAPEVDVNEQIAQRKAKLSALRDKGIAFPNDFRRDSLAADLHAEYDNLSKEELAE